MTDLITLIKKEVWNFLRLWKQTLVPSVITIVLYFAIFGKIIGEKINIDYASMYDIEREISYIEFIFPGLLMMSVIMGSYALTSFGFFTAKMFKSLEELLISPISNNKIII
jgi:ABC-2 type transport system permease protein